MISGTSRVLLVVVIWLAAGQVLSLGEGKRLMTAIDLIEVPRVLDPQLSPDGRQILFTLTNADWKTGRRIGHLWRIQADATGLVRMTNGETGESSGRWSPDGARVAFLARRDSDQTQIHLLQSQGGEARPLSRHATSVSEIAWAPGGGAIYFLATDPKTAEERERERLRDDVFALDENYKQQHLWKISVPGGAEQRITEGDYSVVGFKLSRDGRRIVVQRAPSPLAGDNESGEVWTIDASGANPLRLTRNGVAEDEVELSPDGSQVLFLAGANQQFEPYYNDTLFLVPASGGTPRLLLPDFPYEIERAAWSADGRAIFMVVNMGVHSELFQVDVPSGSGARPDTVPTPRQLTEGRHSVQQWTLAPAGPHVFLLDEPTRFGDVWTLAPGAGGRPTRVTAVYDYLERDFRLPRQEKIAWKGADGVTIEGILYYPVDYQPGRRYPLVVQTHGGPHQSDKFSFGPFVWGNHAQLLTGRGYALLRPNYRGSTGYGNAFMRDMIGGYFRNAHLDVMAGVDHLIAQGLADPDRLATMGWSAGGHMTNKLITFTDRFKAASSGAGAANWISLYAQADIGRDRAPWFGGTPWQKEAPIDVFWEHSPLKHVANVKTPTLFFVGQNDARVPPQQATEMYRALKSHGVPTRLYLAPREGHAISELRHQLFKLNAEMEWFEKYVRGRSYTWEKPREEQDTDRGKTGTP